MVYLETCNAYNNPGHGGKGYTVGDSDIPVMVLFVDGHVKGPFLVSDDFNNGTAPERPVRGNIN